MASFGGGVKFSTRASLSNVPSSYTVPSGCYAEVVKLTTGAANVSGIGTIAQNVPFKVGAGGIINLTGGLSGSEMIEIVVFSNT